MEDLREEELIEEELSEEELTEEVGMKESFGRKLVRSWLTCAGLVERMEGGG